MFLDTVDSDTTNQKECLNKDKPMLIRTKGQFHAVVTPLARRRSNYAPHAVPVLTPLARSFSQP